jgi:hypothetical protein
MISYRSVYDLIIGCSNTATGADERPRFREKHRGSRLDVLRCWERTCSPQHGDTAPSLQHLNIAEIAFYAPMRRNVNVVSGLVTSPFISSKG